MAVKKLIEVALPLEAINSASVREKSIRHGHPSTLHLWWARRPLAAARAVIWASLVDDPSSHPDKYPTEEEQNRERERLFGILEELVQWDNSNDERVLEAASAEIKNSLGDDLPALLDPFAGGGAIPLEGQRLGLESYAQDLNPIAVAINKAMIEIPPRFADMPAVNPNAQQRKNLITWQRNSGLAEDVEYYGGWLQAQAVERIGNLYPKVAIPEDQGGGEATVVAWIWSRTVESPSPLASGAYVPLASTLLLSRKKDKNTSVEIVPDESALDGWRFEVKSGNLDKATENEKANGTKAGRAQDFICCKTQAIIKRSYIQAEGKAGRLSKRLMAIAAQGPNGRVYLSPNPEHEALALALENDPIATDARESFLTGKTPTRAMVTGGVCSAYGLSTWGHLFTGRQLVMLTTLSGLIAEAQEKAYKDAVESGMADDGMTLDEGGSGALAYGQAVGVYLAFVIDKMTDYHSVACSWHISGEFINHVFARQAIPMVFSNAEGNPFSGASGCFENMLGWVQKCILNLPAGNPGHAKQFDAQSDCGQRGIMVSTDPPYYDNISYADISDYFYVWMRQSLKRTYPKLFGTMLVPKSEELVATPYRFGGSVERARDFFEAGMLETLKCINLYAREDIPVTVYYGYKQSETTTVNSVEETASTGWETMLSAIVKAGFSLVGTWPMRTEMATRSIASGTNALASSIVLVCRKRPADAPMATRREFVNTLKRELKPALDKLQTSNIAPVDMAQSAIGPGIGVYSRFGKVLEADGSEMTVRAALQIINQELDLYFSDQDSDLDRESRFCVDLYTQSAFNEIKFGEADVLARAKNTSIDGLAAKGALYASKGVVRLLGRDELKPPDFKKLAEQDGSQAASGFTFTWLFTQQLTHAMETGGVEACAKMLKDVFDSRAENAKALAYRLFTIADKKGWNAEAFAYNSLVVAWPEIQSRAAQLQAEKPVQYQFELEM